MSVALKKYVPTQEIGKGGYGTVYKAQNTKDQTVVAIKRIQLSENEEGVKNSTLREVAISKSLNHPNCIKMIETIIDIKDNVVYCVYEFMPMDLRSYMRQNSGITEKTIKKIIRQLLQGLGYLHQQDIIHRDIKPHNAMIDPQTLTIKLIDFGLARQYSVQPTPMSCSCGTKFFLAPELMLGHAAYTMASDVWGVGLILSQLFSNKYIFPCKENDEGLHKIFEIMGSPKGDTLKMCQQTPKWDPSFEQYNKPTGYSDFMGAASTQAKDLFEHLCDVNWKTRYTCEQALKHPWFDDCNVE